MDIYYLRSLPVRVNLFAGDLVLDCARPSDSKGGAEGPFDATSGPRIWLTRTSDNRAWKLLIHPDDSDPTHCLIIPDETQTARILTETELPQWPD